MHKVTRQSFFLIFVVVAFFPFIIVHNASSKQESNTNLVHNPYGNRRFIYGGEYYNSKGLPSPQAGQSSDSSVNYGPYKNKKLSAEEFNKVIQDHSDWLTSGEASTDKRKANLNGADLSGLNYWSANLSNADLESTNLSRANLSFSNLSGASLGGADLSGADLWLADLSGSGLGYANLSGVSLVGVELSGSNLWHANLSGVIFEPVTLPFIDSFAYAENLERMIYRNSLQALIKLRKAFKEAGFYEQERKITYAINHSEITKFGWSFENIFKYVFFDLTTLWGMAPSRALKILIILIPAFAIPYIVVLRLPSINGIWCKWSDDRIRADLGADKPTRLLLVWPQAIGLGLYFSVLSAFNIGWRAFTVGDWIQRLQPNEYTLRATGWVRTVSGIQSIISVYLFAIWVLTYFGRPFE
jgi:hypothetical protein